MRERDKMKIKIKRVYEKNDKSDGMRILVDRLWPRGLSKETARIDFWAKDISPSTVLRQWYKHDPEKWKEFKNKYFNELNSNLEGVNKLLQHVKKLNVTFVYSSKEQHLNNAVALKEYLESLG
jgi:uncharacterized protein YeaO (DUF488 family)